MEHSGVTTYRNHRDTAGTAQMGSTGLEWERASTPGKCFNWGCLKQKSPSISRKPRAKPRRMLLLQGELCLWILSSPWGDTASICHFRREDRAGREGHLPSFAKMGSSSPGKTTFPRTFTATAPRNHYPGALHRPQKLAGSTEASAQSRGCCSRLASTPAMLGWRECLFPPMGSEAWQRQFAGLRYLP